MPIKRFSHLKEIVNSNGSKSVPETEDNLKRVKYSNKKHHQVNKMRAYVIGDINFSY
jgi:hypothetical protein